MSRQARTRTRASIELAVTVVGSALVVVLALALVKPTPARAATSSDLPPAQRAKLAKLFQPELKPLGLKITRALLQDLETYEVDPLGTHLALYVEPRSADYTGADYVENFSKLVNRFLPRVFERWPGLESFDICQEPLGDPRAAPPPATQIFLTRDALTKVANWRKATLAQLMAAAPRDARQGTQYYVYFAPSLRSEPGYLEAARTAGWTSPTTDVFGR